jgi:hypothetical protein
MKARSEGVEQAVTGLLASGMKGELRKGDTIGLWTYNNMLITDFPRQVWSEAKKNDIVNEVRGYVRSLRYEKRSRLNSALPTILQVAARSERLTVILVFDGADSIKGTPFDKDINNLHRQFARQFRAAGAPVVTVLASRNGTFFDYTINYPSMVIVPHTADPLPPPETIAPPPQITNPPVAPAPPPRSNEIIVSGSNVIRNTSAPAPAVNTTAAANAQPTLAPAAVLASNAAPRVEAAPAAVQAAPSYAAPVAPAPPAAPVVAVVPAKQEAVLTNPAPAAALAATPASPDVHAPATPSPPAANTAPAVSLDAAPASRAAPAAAPVAIAAAGASAERQATMYVMAFAWLIIAVLLALFLARRWRGAPKPSLISQSIDRPR